MNILGLSVFHLSSSVIAVIGVVCMLHQSKWYWYLRMAGNILWLVFFLGKSIDLSAGLQIAYLFFSIFGIIRWKLEDQKRPVPGYLDFIGGLICLITLSMAVFKIVSAMETNYFELAAVIFLVIANWLTAKKNFVCWYFWIIGYGFYAVSWWNSEIYAMCLLHLIFLAISFLGLLDWLEAKRETVI